MVQRFITILTFFLLLTPVFSLSTPSSVFAARSTSNCVVTDVGTPQGDVVLPPECPTVGTGVTGSCGAVVKWADTLSTYLQEGGDNTDGFDNLTQDVPSECGISTPKSSWSENQYWCTYIVVDAYTLAGFEGMSSGALGGVESMRKFFAATPGYMYVDYAKSDHKTAIQSIGPGYAIFMQEVYQQQSDHNHVGIIEKVNVDESGNGKIETIESNASKIRKSYQVAGWEIIPISYPITGFGGHTSI